MVHPCNKPCGNKTASGYCATTACINPQYSNIGTVYYGQGVQKRIITNADRIRGMTDEELAEFIAYSTSCETCVVRKSGSDECHNTNCSTAWLEWLKEEEHETL